MIIDLDLNVSLIYETNTCRLDYLSRKSYNLYEVLRDNIELTRNLGYSTIGSPVLKLTNEVLTLTYSAMQHQINCELYEDLLGENSMDVDLLAQLASLFEITEVLSIRYYDFLEKWALIKDQKERKIIVLDKLSVPA